MKTTKTLTIACNRLGGTFAGFNEGDAFLTSFFTFDFPVQVNWMQLSSSVVNNSAWGLLGSPTARVVVALGKQNKINTLIQGAEVYAVHLVASADALALANSAAPVSQSTYLDFTGFPQIINQNTIGLYAGCAAADTNFIVAVLNINYTFL